MAKAKRDPEREERITMEIVVDCYDEAEQAMGWYYYLQDKLQFPFTAECIIKRPVSPLKVGDKVEVIDMAPAEECEHEVFVLIRWEQESLAVPLAQLQPIGAEAQTVQAVEDWHYWVDQGYQF
jgi:calcium binding protein